MIAVILSLIIRCQNCKKLLVDVTKASHVTKKKLGVIFGLKICEVCKVY